MREKGGLRGFASLTSKTGRGICSKQNPTFCVFTFRGLISVPEYFGRDHRALRGRTASPAKDHDNVHRFPRRRHRPLPSLPPADGRKGPKPVASASSPVRIGQDASKVPVKTFWTVRMASVIADVHLNWRRFL